MTAKSLAQVGPIPIVLAHMGGWKNWDQVSEHLVPTGCFIDTAFSLGSVTPLEDGHYAPEDLTLLSEAAFCDLVHAFGSERVLFGTDIPWADQKTEILKIRALPLKESEKEDILYRNAKKLLSI